MRFGVRVGFAEQGYRPSISARVGACVWAVSQIRHSLAKDGARSMVGGWRRAYRRINGDRAVRNDYWRWMRDTEPGIRRARVSMTGSGISFLVIADATCANDELVHRTLASCRRQSRPWSLLLITGSQPSTGIAATIAADGCVSWMRAPFEGDIATACEQAVQQATADLVVLLAAGDALADDALDVVAHAYVANDEADVLYSDHDVLDTRGRRVTPFFKPAWSPEMLLRGHYMMQLVAYRTGFLRKTGSLRAGFGTAAAYELALRAAFGARQVIHIPHVLCHLGGEKRHERREFAVRGRQALREHLSRLSMAGQVEVDARPSALGQVRFRVRPSLLDEPLVSVVMPFRDRPDLLRRCVGDLLERTAWAKLELVLVDNGSERSDTQRLLDELVCDPRVRAIQDDGTFNWSRVSNLGAAQAQGRYLIFMNNDIGVIDPQWLRLLLEQTQRPQTGMVGPLLLTAAGRVQHAGVSVGTGGSGNASHPLLGLRPWQSTAFGDALWLRNVSAVTGACAMVETELFSRVNGFDESFEVCFGDVELGVRLTGLGYRNIVVPWSALYHFESSTRERTVSVRDIERAREVFARVLGDGDPYFNPNLSRTSPACTLN